MLIFQFEDVPVDEVWGFSIVEPELPAIGFNVALAPNGRTLCPVLEMLRMEGWKLK